MDEVPTATPDVNEMLCFSIYSAGHAFNQLYRPLLNEMGLTYPQFLVMIELWARDGRTVKELGEALFLDSSTLTPLLKRLESAGLITRTRNPDDERQVLLHRTAKGDALREQAKRVLGCINDAVGLDAQAVATIRTALGMIRDSISRRG